METILYQLLFPPGKPLAVLTWSAFSHKSWEAGVNFIFKKNGRISDSLGSLGPPEGVLGDEGEDDGEGDGEMQPGNVGGKERRRRLGNRV